MPDPTDPPSPLNYRSGEDDLQDRKERREAALGRWAVSAQVPGVLIGVLALLPLLLHGNGDGSVLLAIILALLGIWYIIARMLREPNDFWRGVRMPTFVVAFLILICLLNSDSFDWAMYEFTRYGARGILMPASRLALFWLGVILALLILLETGCVVARLRERRRNAG